MGACCDKEKSREGRLLENDAESGRGYNSSAASSKLTAARDGGRGASLHTGVGQAASRLEGAARSSSPSREPSAVAGSGAVRIAAAVATPAPVAPPGAAAALRIAGGGAA